MMLHPTVETALAQAGIEHEVLECDPELADTAAFCAHYGIPLEDSANTIVVASKRPAGVNAACVVLASTRLDANRAVRDALGVKKLSFASGDRTLELTGMELGGVTPFGLPPDLSVLIDAQVVERRRLVLGGGNRSSKVAIDGGNLTRLPQVSVIAGLAIPATM